MTEEMKEVCKKEDMWIQMTPADTPVLNGTAERLNRTLENRIRVMLLDSGLPLEFWQLALNQAVHIHNRTPHKTIGMKTPFVFKDYYSSDFFEKNSYPTKVVYTTAQPRVEIEEEEELINLNEITTDSQVCANLSFSRKRKMNRREKEQIKKIELDEKQIKETEEQLKEEIHELDNSEKIRICESNYFALMCKLNECPQTVKQALKSTENREWMRAIEEELSALKNNNTWSIVKRPKDCQVIDSRWVFVRKNESNGSIRYKARLVVRWFKDHHQYDYSETYAPVANIIEVRALFTIANKYG